MAASFSTSSPVPLGTIPRGELSHRTWIILLLLVALVPRVYAVLTAVAPARDSFRFFRAAQTYERLGFWEGSRVVDVHPLYPLALLGLRQTLAVAGLDGPFPWVHAAQAFSIACSLAFLILAYAAGAGLWNRRVAALGCMAIAVVPRQIGYAVDVLSDTLHAALWMASFAAAVWWWRTDRARYAFLAALAAALAYLTRIEAVVLPLSFIAATTAGQLVPKWRRRWGSVLSGSALYLATFAIMAGSYMNQIGGLSPRQSARALVGGPTVPEPQVTLETPLTRLANRDTTEFLPLAHPLRTPSADDPRPVDLTPRPFVEQEGYLRRSFLGAVGLVLFELGEETRVWLAALALVAVVDRRRSLTAMPAGLLPCFAVVACACMLVLLPIKAGYLAGRYMMPILPLISMFGITGAEALVRRLAHWPSWGRQRRDAGTVLRYRVASSVAALVATGLVLCVPGWFRPLHKNRFGHMQAAAWLTRHSDPDDLIFDPNHFSAFFANRTTWQPVGTVPERLPARFAVIDVAMIYRTDNVTHQTIAKVDAEARLVAEFPKAPGGQEAGVYVFEIPGPGVAQKRSGGRRL